MGLDARSYRDIWGSFATGVTVVTTDVDGWLHGMTANGVVSVSLDPLLMLVSVEIMLTSVNVSLAAFSHHLGDARGQVIALFVIAVAAGEAAIGLGLVLALSRNKQGVNVEDVTQLKW